MSCNNCNSCSCNHSSLIDISNVQELIPYHQYAVGEFFKIGNDIYKTVGGYDCENCENCENYINDSVAGHFDCSSMKCYEQNYILFDQLDGEQN